MKILPDHTEKVVTLHIEKLPEGVYLATSDDVPGLVAQGSTIAETVEIAKGLIPILREVHAEQETAYLLQSPENARRLLESIAELEKGKGIERQLIE